jgi:hypothetical protein
MALIERTKRVNDLKSGTGVTNQYGYLGKNHFTRENVRSKAQEKALKRTCICHYLSLRAFAIK